MGALQSSVPFGVMIGYIIAAVLVGPISSTDVCFRLLCWRWPLLFEWAMLFPFCIAIHFVPSRHFAMNDQLRDLVPNSNGKPAISYNTFPSTTHPNIDCSNFKIMNAAMKAHSFATIESKINRQLLTENDEKTEVRDERF